MNHIKTFRALIFDMDGLMVDTETGYWAVLAEIAAGYHIKEITEATRTRMMGRTPLESMSIFAADLKITASVAELLRQRETLMEARLRKGVTPMKGLFEIIDRFDGRLQLAVATSSSGLFLDLVLDNLAIRNKFNMLQAAEGITHGKPDPEIFLKIIVKLNLEPADCIVLEDSLNGVLAGVNAGCYVIAVPSEYSRHQDFSMANFVAGDLTEARAHIATLMPEE